MTEVTATASQHTVSQNMVQTVQSNQAQDTERTASDALFGEDGLTFLDVLDVINPLQHIPVVNTMYREITGDEISGAARMAGGTLYGGVFGLLASAVNWVVDELTGDDLGGHVMTALNGETDTGRTPETGPKTAPNAQTQTAQLSTDDARAEFLADPIAFVLGGTDTIAQQSHSSPDPMPQSTVAALQSVVAPATIQTSAAGRIGVWDHAAYEVPPVYDMATATAAPKAAPYPTDQLPADQLAALKAYASDIQTLRAQMMALPK